MDANSTSQIPSPLTTTTNSSICPDCSDNTSSEFSIENVVGMFLTLSLCLLTQPYGSLLYRPLSSENSSGFLRRVFFLWRLNPLACAGEALVIGFCLLKIVSSGRKDGHRWKKHLHINAAALLLLRANDHGGGERGGSVLEKLLSARFLDEDDSITNSPGEEPTATTAAAQNSGSSPQPLPQPGVIRRRTTLAEAGVGTENLNDENLRFLRRALGSNVLAHEEKWVDLVTAFSVVVVIIKLAATTLPWDVRVPAAFMLAGWCSVQLLLYLFHLEELEESAMIPIARAARRHKADMGNRWVGIALSGLAAPAVGYLGYNSVPTGDWDNIRDSSSLTSFASDILIISFVGPVGLCAALLLPSVVVALLIFFGLNTCVSQNRALAAAFLAVFGLPFATLGLIITYPWANDWWIAASKFIVGASVALFLWLQLMIRTRYISESQGLSGGVVLFNNLVTLVVLSLMLSSYDPTGTYKPGYLDVLG